METRRQTHAEGQCDKMIVTRKRSPHECTTVPLFSCTVNIFLKTHTQKYGHTHTHGLLLSNTEYEHAVTNSITFALIRTKLIEYVSTHTLPREWQALLFRTHLVWTHHVKPTIHIIYSVPYIQKIGTQAKRKQYHPLTGNNYWWNAQILNNHRMWDIMLPLCCCYEYRWAIWQKLNTALESILHSLINCLLIFPFSNHMHYTAMLPVFFNRYVFFPLRLVELWIFL